MSLTPVQPEGWPPPRGYSNGVVTRGALLHIGGQIGWRPDGTFESEDLLGQFAQCLDNVLAVARAAGAGPADIARMTVYVTDLDAYRRSLSGLKEVWRARLGRHYPAMAMVGVTGLVEPRALVEIEAVAVLSDVSTDTKSVP
ncbi:MAG: RidA family protein [Deltaproteobacteria bacterium]|nr:RidA family protein [Deltaproteobacteria bacterium]